MKTYLKQLFTILCLFSMLGSNLTFAGTLSLEIEQVESQIDTSRQYLDNRTDEYKRTESLRGKSNFSWAVAVISLAFVGIHYASAPVLTGTAESVWALEAYQEGLFQVYVGTNSMAGLIKLVSSNFVLPKKAPNPSGVDSGIDLNDVRSEMAIPFPGFAGDVEYTGNKIEKVLYKDSEKYLLSYAFILPDTEHSIMFQVLGDTPRAAIQNARNKINELRSYISQLINTELSKLGMDSYDGFCFFCSEKEKAVYLSYYDAVINHNLYIAEKDMLVEFEKTYSESFTPSVDEFRELLEQAVEHTNGAGRLKAELGNRVSDNVYIAPYRELVRKAVRDGVLGVELRYFNSNRYRYYYFVQ